MHPLNDATTWYTQAHKNPLNLDDERKAFNCIQSRVFVLIVFWHHPSLIHQSKRSHESIFSSFFLSLASIIFYSKTNFFIHSRYVQTEAPPNMAPQSSQKSIMEMSVDRGSKIHLPCNIQGSPLPVYTWYRLSDSSSFYSVPSSQRIIPSQTLLLIRNVEERDAGRWVSFQPPLWDFSN